MNKEYTFFFSLNLDNTKASFHTHSFNDAETGAKTGSVYSLV